jgi:Domain of unknown function (DUF222)/HNH endonuclease
VSSVCTDRPGEFASAVEAAEAAGAALAFLAGADAASLPGEVLADCVRALGRAESAHLAARSRFLSAFNAAGACEADGQATTKAWLRSQTRVTQGAAGAGMAWMRRLAVHPRVAAMLAAGEMSASWARQVCDWSDALPPDVRDDADQILLTAAGGGADLADLAGLAREMHERTAAPEPDDEPGQADDGFSDRWARLDVHYQGAGRLEGNLTPGCAAAVGALLDALGGKAGPEDDRSLGQRHHDALEEAARMLLATGTLPDVAGQPAHVLVHATLDQILGRTHPDSGESPAGGSGLAETGQAGTAGGFAAGRAAGDGEPGWLASAAAAQAYACDAKITTIVTGQLDPEIVAAAVRACLGREDAAGGQDTDTSEDPAAGRDRLAATLIRYGTAMLSGPGGLASALRAGLPGPLGAGVSLPLDITSPAATVPPHLRRAVIARDRHCAFPGCHQRPARCHVHHVIPRSRGGPTALGNLVLLCAFHHLYLIHRRGWTLVLNADGTTTATSPGRRKILHSHPPPGTAAA